MDIWKIKPGSSQVSAPTLFKGNRVQNLGFGLLSDGIEIHGMGPSFLPAKLPRHSLASPVTPQEGSQGFQEASFLTPLTPGDGRSRALPSAGCPVRAGAALPWFQTLGPGCW